MTFGERTTKAGIIRMVKQCMREEEELLRAINIDREVTHAALKALEAEGKIELVVGYATGTRWWRIPLVAR